MTSPSPLLFTHSQDLSSFREHVMGDLGVRVFTTLTAAISQDKDHVTIVHLDYHVERLRTSSAALLETPAEELRDLERHIISAIHASEPSPGETLCVRVVLSYSSCAICVTPHRPLWQPGTPIRLLTQALTRSLPEHKTTAAVASAIAFRRATEGGASEALLIDADETIREGAWSCFFWFAKNGDLFSTKNAVLPGISKRIICNLTDCSFADHSLSHVLTHAEECFVSQSTTGITPVSHINRHAIGSEAPGPRTRALMESLEAYNITAGQQYRLEAVT